jgi:hypothetical protein
VPSSPAGSLGFPGSPADGEVDGFEVDGFEVDGCEVAG